MEDIASQYQFKNHDVNIEDCMKKYKNMIIHLSKKYGIYYILELEDILQEGYLVLWNSINTYDSEKASFNTYYWVRLKRHFYNIKKHHNTYKKKGTIVSIETNVAYNSDIFLRDTLTDHDSVKQHENLYFYSYIDCIIDKYKLTETESLVLKNVIFWRDQGHRKIYCILNKKCSLKRKTVDNALTRIKKKIPFNELFE